MAMAMAPAPVRVPLWSIALFAIGFVAVPFAINAIGAAVVKGSAAAETLRSVANDRILPHALVPPGWAFALVWTVLYALMGVSLGLVLHNPPRNSFGARYETWVAGLVLFCAGVVTNWAWPLVFERASPTHALWLLLFAAALATTAAVLFADTSRGAAACLAPLLVWYGYATLLNVRAVRDIPA